MAVDSFVTVIQIEYQKTRTMKTKQQTQASKLTSIAEEKKDILVKKATTAAKELKEKVETKIEGVGEKIKEKFKESEEKLEKLGKKTGVKSAVEKASGKIKELMKEE
jgi:polysaccharide pyruvyl transferase WcaK-like protein